VRLRHYAAKLGKNTYMISSPEIQTRNFLHINDTLYCRSHAYVTFMYVTAHDICRHFVLYCNERAISTLLIFNFLPVL
jgi:hypothetical protein